MAMIAIELTTPPTIAVVCELLPPESDTAGEDEEAGSAGRVVVVLAVGEGTPVGGGEVVLLPVGPVLEEPDPPINVPGPTSGLSERRRCEKSGDKKTERRFPTASGYRLVHIPTILQLARDVGSCQRK